MPDDRRVYPQPVSPVPGGDACRPADEGHDLLRAAIALRAALQQTGDTLATPSLAALLESEAGLAAALTVLPTSADILGEHRDRIFHELALARQELSRCRRLGAAFSKTITRTLRGQGVAADYGPDGRRTDELADGSAGLLRKRG